MSKRTQEEKNKYAREWYKKNSERLKKELKVKRDLNKDTINEQARIRNNNLRLKILSFYSNSTLTCARCGFDDTDVLVLDHINDGGRKHKRDTVSGQAFYHWLRKNDFPPGLQVLCCNCNWKKEVLRKRDKGANV